MQTETLRTIKDNPQTASKLDKIALKLGRSNRQVFAQMVDYFYRSKKDPLDINDDLLKNTLLKQNKDYIGFIKTQENDYRYPYSAGPVGYRGEYYYHRCNWNPDRYCRADHHKQCRLYSFGQG
jgi:hypothetical protein